MMDSVGWQELVIVLVIIAMWAVIIGGIVLLAMKLGRRGKSKND